MSKLNLTPELYQYCLNFGVRESEELTELRLKTKELATAHMQITPEQGALLAMLARLLNVKNYLEVGVFTGYSTLWVAQNIAADAKITALDINQNNLNLAQRYWQKANIAHKITTYLAPAKDSLNALNAKKMCYDMVFIDANKSDYIEYYELCLTLLRPNGLIVIDNVLIHGLILEDQPRLKYVKVLQELNQRLKNDDRVEICILPIGDGMTLVQKKDLKDEA